jgi:serine/threonine protein kinase
VTTKCDVYSFGVVVLEIVMGRYPTELQYIASVGEHHNKLAVKGMLDQRPSAPTKVENTEIDWLVEVAFCCLQTSPQSRPEMQEVYQKLSHHQQSYASVTHSLALNKLLEEITDGEV